MSIDMSAVTGAVARGSSGPVVDGAVLPKRGPPLRARSARSSGRVGEASANTFNCAVCGAVVART